MKTVIKTVLWALAILNIIVIGAMIVCAYSVYLTPFKYPNWSYLGMIMPIFLVATVIFIPVWLIIKREYCLISIAGIALCWGSIRDYCPINIMQGEPSGASLKVMSYNVFSFNNYNYEDNQTEIVNYITNSGAGIVCLQEATKIKEQHINDALRTFYPYIETGNAKDINCAILSKYPVLSCQEIDLNSKSASCCLYDVLVGADTVKVINCHLESYKLNDEDKQMYKQMIKNSNPLTDDESLDDYDVHDSFLLLGEKLAKANSIRSLQADTIASIIENIPNKYIIMCGDFNDSPISYVHKTLTQRLKDAYTESGNGPGLSYNRSGMYFRIDNIIISDSFNSFDAKVDKTIYESDHYPIFCTLEMQ